MLKRLALVAAFAFSFSSLAAVTDNALIGRWLSTQPVYSGNGINIYLGMAFDQTNLTASTLCTFPDGSSLEPTVVVPVNAGSGQIQVTGTANNTLKSGANECTVSIEPGTVTYTVNGNSLVMSADGQSLPFNRR